MRRILLSVAAAVLSLSLTAAVEAAPPRHGSSHSGSSHEYYRSHGSKLKNGGYYYRGKDHDHWSYRHWDKHYGCYCYYDSGLSCYYYWCEPDGCYYPMDYCPYGKYSW